MPDIVWHSTVDDEQWSVHVEQTPNWPYRGKLVVKDVFGEVVHTEEVGVSYAARFGPDVADVSDWQLAALNVIDHPELRRPP